MPTAACRPFSELIDTSEPPSRSFWPAYLATMNEPVRQTSTTERNSSTARSVISPRLPKPAQFTTTSSGPISSKSRCTEDSSVTSTSAAVCGSPSSAARARAPSPLRSATVTRHPSAARARAVAQPIPDAAPMTTAIRSLLLLIRLAFRRRWNAF